MEQEEYLESNLNRINEKLNDIALLRKSDDKMLEIISTLTETEVVPAVGRYYTFIYIPKTPKIRYDEHPLVACIQIFNWGFRGINYHWGDYRNYTWEEIIGYLHIVYPMELFDMRSIPYQKIKINN